MRAAPAVRMRAAPTCRRLHLRRSRHRLRRLAPLVRQLAVWPRRVRRRRHARRRALLRRIRARRSERRRGPALRLMRSRAHLVKEST